MRIKVLCTCLLFLILKFTCFGQQSLPVYPLLVPENWHTEKFALPPPFVAALPFKGTEDIRFSPEWAKKGSEGYWTYAFLWTIADKATFTQTQLEKYLHDYYTGLVKTNLKEAKIDTAIATPVKVKLRSIKMDDTDIQAFEGKVEMMDYMTQNPLSLNLRIHVKKVKPGINISAVYFEASPQPYEHKVWVQLDELDKGL
ncbi:MAG: hypothetical protein JWQ57_974 [Mucilaginibacter sp.]|nr:hypothetical protein [Mucilaginibacter sp.]